MSLLNLTQSQSFSNIAVTANIYVPLDADLPMTGKTSPVTTTVGFDLTNDSYTITTNGRTQTFYQAERDASLETAASYVFLKTAGTTTNSLTLTRPGASGRLRYQYVGGGYWQRTINEPTFVQADLDAFVYGFKTPGESVRRSGRAEYLVDLVGVQSGYASVMPLAGEGVAQVDFATGTIITHGSLLLPGSTLSGGTFLSEAKLSSDKSQFSGNFRFSQMLATGAMTGSFFGPSADEFGAAFNVGTGASMAVGTLTGRGSAVSQANAVVRVPTVNEFYSGAAMKLVTTLQGMSGWNTGSQMFSDASVQAQDLIINYDATLRSYTVIAPDRSGYFDGTTSPGTFDDTTPTGPVSLSHVASRMWRRNEPVVGGNSRYTFEPFLFGHTTSASSLPRTGRAGYAVTVTGMAADNDFPNLARLTGWGALYADFAAGTLTGEGQVRYTEDYQIAGSYSQGQRVGQFSTTSAITSNSSDFSGTITFTGMGAYSGGLRGSFFGPNAEEIGAAFSATDGAGGALVGTLLGLQDNAATAAPEPLAGLTRPTDISYYEWVNRAAKHQVTGIEVNSASGIYTVNLKDTGVVGGPIYQVAINPANQTTSDPTSPFNAYTGTFQSDPAQLRLLKPPSINPSINLTYTSLATVVTPTPVNGKPLDYRHYIAFGVRTPDLNRPISGTATYDGIAIGSGQTGRGALATPYEVQGAVSLVANFGTNSITSTLNLTGTSLKDGSVITFPEFKTSGETAHGDFTAQRGVDGLYMRGSFYGPNAQEFGGLFSVTQGDGASTIELSGAMAGKVR
jgi:hypothetical protein